MADPRAEFVLTARDATGTAIKSAERGLKGMIATARSARTAFASIGVGLSVRAFSSWIASATDVNKLTAAQIEETKAARQAFTEFKEQSDQLARGLADVLAPAVKNLAISFGLLRQTFLPTEQEKFNQELDTTNERINNLIADIEAAQGKIGKKFLGFLPVKGLDASIENMQMELARLVAARQSMLDKQDTTAAGPIASITQDELINLELFIRELNSIEPVKPIEMLTQDEWVRLEEFLYELNNLPTIEPVEMITQDELVALEEFIYELNHGEKAIADMNTEAVKLGETIGRGLHDTFVDFLVDGEAQFKDFVKRLAAEFLTSQLFGAFSTAFAGKPFLSGLFGGARANGGPVSAGKADVVGEHGPEMFMPGASGAIIPNMAMAGGDVYVTNHNTFYGTPPADAARHQAETIRRIRADLKNERERGRS